MLKKLAFQSIALITVSLLIGLCLSSFGVNTIVGILIGAFLQIVGFSVYNSLLSTFIALKVKKIELQKLKELSFQGLEVTCPCYKKITDFVPITLNTSNYYKCKECSKLVSVQVFSETAITTEPLTTELPIIDDSLIKKITNENP